MTAFDKTLKVRIVQPGMQTYTGYIRGNRFISGASVDPITVRDALLIGASCSLEDEDGNGLNPNTYKLDHTVEVPASSTASAPPPAPEPEPEEEVEETFDDVVEFSDPGEELAAPKEWTVSELEDIADAEGIGGLREIGDEYGIKDRSIDGFIQQILKHQSGTDKLAGEE